MKVLILDPAGSGAMVTHNLCNHLAEQGCEVEVISGPHWARTVGDSPMKYRLQLEFYRKTQLQSYAAKNAVMRWLWRGARFCDHLRGMASFSRQAKKADIVHAHFFPVPAIDYVFLYLITRHTPLVCTVHEIVPHNSRFRSFTGACFRAIYKRADILLDHTEHTRRQLVDELKLPESKIVRVRIGKMEHLAEKGMASTNSAGRDDTPIALFAGYIRKDKGIDVLINAAFHLRKQQLAFKVVIAGRPSYDLSSVKKLASDLGVADVVEFHLGYMQENEFARRLREATVVVLPYRRAEQSAVAVAACTFGKAIVATRCGGLEELVNEAGNGILVPVDDPVALADAIGLVLTDCNQRREFERRSKAYAEQELSLKAISEKTLAAYRAAINRRERPSGTSGVTTLEEERDR